VGNGILVCLAFGIFVPAIKWLYVVQNFFPADEYDYATVWLAALWFAWYFLSDGLYYAWHRAQHRFGFFWTWHAVHHGDTSLRASSYIRLHWSEPIIQSVFIGLPIAILFQSMQQSLGFLLLAGLMSAWTFLIHADLPWGYGWISRVVTTPAQHLVHHSIDERHFNRNFAGYFPFWDIVFGTYLAPERHGAIVTGVKLPPRTVQGRVFCSLRNKPDGDASREKENRLMIQKELTMSNV
jgi:sterol desaturase/sphingolipid hydroxylase (fatty acid hydroxylase superfamily)